MVSGVLSPVQDPSTFPLDKISPAGQEGGLWLTGSLPGGGVGTTVQYLVVFFMFLAGLSPAESQVRAQRMTEDGTLNHESLSGNICPGVTIVVI